LGTILLVEDDAVSRYATARRLRNYGYQVLPARNSSEALDISRTWDGSIDLLCSDVRLPGVDGTELALRIKQERPLIGVLYITGCCEVAGALLKPFTDEQLKAAVAAALYTVRTES